MATWYLPLAAAAKRTCVARTREPAPWRASNQSCRMRNLEDCRPVEANDAAEQVRVRDDQRSFVLGAVVERPVGEDDELDCCPPQPPRSAHEPLAQRVRRNEALHAASR